MLGVGGDLINLLRGKLVLESRHAAPAIEDLVLDLLVGHLLDCRAPVRDPVSVCSMASDAVLLEYSLPGGELRRRVGGFLLATGRSKKQNCRQHQRKKASHTYCIPRDGSTKTIIRPRRPHEGG